MSLSCNLGTLTSWNTLGHSRPVKTLLLYLLLVLRPSRVHEKWAYIKRGVDKNDITIIEKA